MQAVEIDEPIPMQVFKLRLAGMLEGLLFSAHQLRWKYGIHRGTAALYTVLEAGGRPKLALALEGGPGRSNLSLLSSSL